MKSRQAASLEHVLEQNRTTQQTTVRRKEKLLCGTICLFTTAFLLVIALAVSIVLVFIIGVIKAQHIQSTDAVYSYLSISPVNLPDEPCSCGCPSIEPILNNETSGITARIINGSTARANSWPWQMFLLAYNPQTKLTHSCGATLITNRHLLTAAHCVHGSVPSYIAIYPGLHARNISSSSSTSRLPNKVYIHEGYNSRAHNDIAILATEEPFRFDSHISPICLATPNSSFLQANEELVAIGWGRVSAQPETQVYPKYLQQIQVTYVPPANPNCSGILESRGSMHSGQMCAGKPGHNVCNGDSGGPLMRRRRLGNTETYYWQQVGLASLSKDCGWNSTWPDIYTNVPYYYDWIIQTLKRDVKK